MAELNVPERKLTPTQEAAKDYLGHPCDFTEATRRFAAPLEEAQSCEHRAIKRKVGMLLLELGDRINHAHHASDALFDMAGSIDDDGQLHALMGMLSAHELKTANMFYDFAGLVLASFESDSIK